MHTHIRLALVVLSAALVPACAFEKPARAQSTAAIEPTRVFEIRTYTTEPGRLEALHARFRDHTTRLFEKHGMTNIGYWTPADEPRSQNTLIYILAHPSRAAATKKLGSIH